MDNVTTGVTSLIDRPCVVKSITFTPYNSDGTQLGPVTVNIFDGSTELFTLAKQGLPSYENNVVSYKFPVGGLRIDDSFEIELEGDSSRSAKGVTVLYQAGSNDDVA